MAATRTVPETEPGSRPTGWEPGTTKPTIVKWTFIVLGTTAFILALANSTRDISGTRVARRPGSYVPERNPFLGDSNVYLYNEIAIVVIFLAVLGTAIYGSVKRGKPTPLLIMFVATTCLVVLDPIMNWAPYVTYDPRMLHFPVNWPWVSLAPTVEPVIPIGAYGFFFVLPALITLAVYKRLATRVSSQSWFVRKPRLGVLVLSIPICIVFDALIELIWVRVKLYHYAQVIPFGSTNGGTSVQFPLIWEAVLFGLVLAATAPLMWANDQGKTWGETFALRFRIFRGRPHIGAVAVTVALMIPIYIAYGLCFGLIRATGVATEVATPWDYPETAVYDPQGYFEKAGNPGPYYSGIWSGWERNAIEHGH